jgi:hypothetical protein
MTATLDRRGKEEQIKKTRVPGPLYNKKATPVLTWDGLKLTYENRDYNAV